MEGMKYTTMRLRALACVRTCTRVRACSRVRACTRVRTRPCTLARTREGSTVAHPN